MRIEKLKISGFKSFVDATVLELPGNLTGVVGPNGCGKSNVIDALTWVLGESSAKYLRGESMDDVIFNGSVERKEVGQASVEIILDNSQGSIKGHYESFAEVSVKRVLNRESGSTYLINGIKCRKRDVVDIFLGTGVSPRQYSVVGQGMISQIVDSKPEEMRGFIEEAAGVSKYRERRRETENKIKQTQLNINRLNDILDELASQLNKLKRQASAARTYTRLKEEEKALKLKSLAIRWGNLSSEERQFQLTLSKKKVAIEKVGAEASTLLGVEEELKLERLEISTQIEKCQDLFYEKSTKISEYEQADKLVIEQRNRIEKELTGCKSRLEESINLVEKKESENRDLKSTIEKLEIELSADKSNYDSAQRQLLVCEDSQDKKTSLVNESANILLELEKKEHKIELSCANVKEQLQINKQDLIRFSDELASIDFSEAKEKIENLTDSIHGLEEERSTRSQDREGLKKHLLKIKTELKDLNLEIHQHKADLQQKKGEFASLSAIQESAYGNEGEKLVSWFKEKNIKSFDRLLSNLKIEEGWEVAFEKAINFPLTSFLGNPDRNGFDIQNILSDAPSEVTIIDNRQKRTASKVVANTLEKKIILAPDFLRTLSRRVFTASSIDEAYAIAEGLGEEECVVTQSGLVIGMGWLKIPSAKSVSESIIVRKEYLLKLGESIRRSEGQLAIQNKRLEDLEQQQKQLEDKENGFNSNLEMLDKKLLDVRHNLLIATAEVDSKSDKADQLNEDILNVKLKIFEQEKILKEQTVQMQAIQKDVKHRKDEKALLSSDQDAAKISLESARLSLDNLTKTIHEKELVLQESEVLQRAAVATIGEATINIEKLGIEVEDLKGELSKTRSPIELNEDDFKKIVFDKEKIIAEQKHNQQLLTVIDGKQKDLESHKKEKNLELDKAREERQKIEIDLNAVQVRKSELSREVSSFQVDEGSLHSFAEEGDNQDSVKEELFKLERKISRLGPLNLAAIEEFQELEKRKTHLDVQHRDLTDALETLVKAISKIDSETKSRFKETFDNINKNLGETFKRLFGGGTSNLVLTESNLLETGVSIHAHPPGKKNANIQQLSGGEKALTAIAVIFTIFKLKPSPFCLLDEVDAPLDDSNVVRLVEMVKEMSGTVQFLFVTHNKLTMEIADQLIGITMQEPGVSRLVSVNVAEAAEMADIA